MQIHVTEPGGEYLFPVELAPGTPVDALFEIPYQNADDPKRLVGDPWLWVMAPWQDEWQAGGAPKNLVDSKLVTSELIDGRIRLSFTMPTYTIAVFQQVEWEYGRQYVSPSSQYGKLHRVRPSTELKVTFRVANVAKK